MKRKRLWTRERWLRLVEYALEHDPLCEAEGMALRIAVVRSLSLLREVRRLGSRRPQEATGPDERGLRSIVQPTGGRRARTLRPLSHWPTGSRRLRRCQLVERPTATLRPLQNALLTIAAGSGTPIGRTRCAGLSSARETVARQVSREPRLRS